MSFKELFKDNKENEDLNKYVVLKADKGLKKLTHWLMNENNNVYILSENQGANLSMQYRAGQY